MNIAIFKNIQFYNNFFLSISINNQMNCNRKLKTELNNLKEMNEKMQKEAFVIINRLNLLFFSNKND